MEKVTIHEAKTHLSRLIRKIEAGEEIIICRGHKEVARLVSIDAGSHRGVRETDAPGFKHEMTLGEKRKAFFGCLKGITDPDAHDATESAWGPEEEAAFEKKWAWLDEENESDKSGDR